MKINRKGESGIANVHKEQKPAEPNKDADFRRERDIGSE
jgi:hypothetical protein